MSLEKSKSRSGTEGISGSCDRAERINGHSGRAAEALDVKPGMIAKTMSFLQGEKAVLILTEGTAKVDNHKYKDTFHVKAKMIPFDQVEARIGHAPGGVCLPQDPTRGIEVYLDDSLKQF